MEFIQRSKRPIITRVIARFILQQAPSSSANQSTEALELTFLTANQRRTTTKRTVPCP